MQSTKPKFRIGFPYNETQKGIFIMKISVSVTMRTLETLGGIEAGFKALHDAGF